MTDVWKSSERLRGNREGVLSENETRAVHRLIESGGIPSGGGL
jgi:hypothetical protein